MSSIFLRNLLFKSKNCLIPARRLNSSSCKKQTSLMDQLASPAGNWQTFNSATQKKYALHLVLGVGALMLTLAFGFANNLFESFSDIPAYPAEIDCYKPEVEEPPEDPKKKK